MKPVSVGITGTWGGESPRVLRKGTKQQGQAVSYMTLDGSAKHHSWVIVVWDGANVPTCEPFQALLFKHSGERTFKPDVLRR